MDSKAKHRNGSAVSPATDRRVPALVGAKLDAGVGTIFVEAPAGYGKTRLLGRLAGRATDSGRQVAWVKGRLQSDASQIANAVGELGSGRPSLLIVDDAHLLADGGIQTIERLIDDSDRVQVAVASRTPLRLGVSRRVMAREAVVLRAADLALTDAGLSALLAEAGSTDPSLRGTIARLAEGWPVGALMAIAEVRNGATDRSALLDHLTRTGGELDRFLEEEVMADLSSDVADLLAIFGTLGTFAPPLLEAAAGIADGEAAIVGVERQGLFVGASSGAWRSINPMVGAWLEARLRRHEPDRSRSLHLAAAGWHEAENRLSDAITHAFAGGDAELAARLLARSSSTHERLGRWRAFTDWTRRLDEATLDRYPSIRLEAAPAHAVLFEFDAARHHVARLERQSSQLSPSDQIAMTSAQAILAAFADQPERALEAGERGRTAKAPVDAYTSGVFQTASAIGRIARGELAEARRLAIEARTIHERGGGTFGAIFAHGLSGLTHAIEGQLDLAVSHWQESRRLVARAENADALQAVALGHLPLILYEWNELAEAEELIERCLASTVEVALPDAIASLYVAACRIAAARGDDAGVARWASEGMALATRREWSRLYTAVAWEPITLALRNGRLSEARRLRKRLDRDRRLLGPPRDGLEVEGDCGALRYDLMVSGDRAAFAAVRSAYNRARNEGRHWRAARLLAIEAIGRERGGDRPGALRAARRALELGRPARLIRTFVDEGPSLTGLIVRIATEEARATKPAIDLDFLNELLEAGGEQQRPLLEDNQSEVEALSPRERDVLSMAAAGLSNRLIGERLFMSENTVKWHLQHVFAKLGAPNRTSAIIVARNHGFVD